MYECEMCGETVNILPIDIGHVYKVFLCPKHERLINGQVRMSDDYRDLWLFQSRFKKGAKSTDDWNALIIAENKVSLLVEKLVTNYGILPTEL